MLVFHRNEGFLKRLEANGPDGLSSLAVAKRQG